MSVMRPSWRCSLAGVAILAALGPGIGLVWAEKPKAPAPVPGRPGPAVGPLEGRAADVPQRIKVFRLSHRDPQELGEILASLLTLQPAGPGSAPGFGPVMGGMLGGAPAFPGGGGVIGGGPPGFPGGPGIGGFGIVGGGAAPGPVRAWVGPAGAQPMLHLASDARSRTLLARGTDKDVALIADIVKALDVPADQEAPRVKDLRVFKLRFAEAGNVAEVLKGLGIDARVARDPKANRLVVLGPDAVVKEVAEVVEALDAEVKGTNDENPR